MKPIFCLAFIQISSICKDQLRDEVIQTPRYYMYESTLSKGELSIKMGEDGKEGERFLEMIMNLHF